MRTLNEEYTNLGRQQQATMRNFEDQFVDLFTRVLERLEQDSFFTGGSGGPAMPGGLPHGDGRQSEF